MQDGTLLYVRKQENGLETSIRADIGDDDLAQIMVAIFAKMAERPNLNLLKFQLQMAGAMQAMVHQSNPPGTLANPGSTGSTESEQST